MSPRRPSMSAGLCHELVTQEEHFPLHRCFSYLCQTRILNSGLDNVYAICSSSNLSTQPLSPLKHGHLSPPYLHGLE
jgi:hypothetical protein